MKSDPWKSPEGGTELADVERNPHTNSLVFAVERAPEGVYLVDTFTVPAAARPEFEATMRRNREFIRKLDGFRGDAVLVRQNGDETFDIATLAAWESAAAIARAREQVTDFYREIGFDMSAVMAGWGVKMSRVFCSAPPELQ